MQKTFLPIFLVIVLSLSTIPVFSFADDTVAPYTTTSYGPDYPWWSIYHLTSPTAAANSVKGGEGGQMIHSMAVSSDGLKLYYGLDTGGIYTSDDGGVNWRLSQEALKVNGSNSMTVDPDNKNIAFSTGFLCSGTTVNGNTGIYRTTDGGDHWSQVLNTDYYYVQTNNVIKFGATHQDGHRTIYAGTHSKGIFKSEDGGDTWTNIGCTGDTIEDLYVDPSNAIPSVIAEVSEQSGVVVSTDGGTTWTPRNSGLPGTDVLSLAVDPAEPSIWFVTVNGDKKLYKSTDSGTTWSAAGDMTSVLQNGQPTKLNFSAYDGIHTPILYIAVAGNENCFRYSPDLGEHFYTPDYDQTNALRNQTGYWPEAMAASPTDPWTVWAGIDGVIYKSSYNSGTGHLVLTPSSSGSSGMRAFDMAFDNAGNIQYIGVMDHGIYKAVTGSGTDYPPVTHLSNVQRYNGLWSCLGLTVDPNDPNHIFAKVGDWGSNLIIEESKDGGATWNQIAGTNGYWGEVEYNNKNDQVIYAAGFRSDDNGGTWKKLSMIISAISPVDNNVVYAVSGGTKIYKSSDRGDTWVKVATVPDNINNLTADNLKSDRVWTGTEGNGMYIVDGKNVTHIGPAKLAPSVNGNNGIFKVVQDPNNPFHYMAGGCDNIAHGPGAGVFESWDGGNNWEQVPGMPGMKDIWTLNINPVKPLLYACTSNGIVVYDWSKRTNLPTPEITPVRVDKYSENFNDDKAQGWTLSGILTGSAILSSSDSGNNTAVYEWQVAAAPYEYKIDVSTNNTGDSNRMKVIFNYQDENNYDYLDFGSSNTPTISLNEVVGGSVTDSVQSDAIYNFGGDATTLDLKYTFDGKITVDAIRGNSTTNLFTDIAYDTFKSVPGKIGVGTDNCAGGTFDNISLMDASATDASVPHEITSYSEDFNDGHANNWTLSQGFTVDQNGVLTISDTSVPQKAIYTPGIATTPYEYKLDLYTSDTDDSNKMIVYFNYSDSSNYDYLEFGAGNSTTVTLNKVAASVKSTIATSDTTFNFQGPDWTTLDIKCGNDGLFNIDAIQGGQTTHLFTNATSEDGVQFDGYVSLSEGLIGVGTSTGASINVDNIQVNSLADTGNISHYTEDFNDNTAQGWVYTDNTNIDLKCVHIDGWQNSRIIYVRQNVDAPSDFRMKFFMNEGDPISTEDFYFGYKDEENFYYLAIGEGSPSIIKLHRVVDGDDQVIATSTAVVTYGGVCVSGAEPIVDISCDVNGIFNIDVIHNSTTTNLFSTISLPDAAFGKIGFGTSQAAYLYFDDVVVTGTLYATPEITAAIHAIRALPAADDLTLDDQQAVANVRALVNTALLNGTAADITNLDKLLACEAKIQSLRGTTPTSTTTTTTTTTTAAIPENGLIKVTPEVNGDTAKVAVKRDTLNKAFDQVKEDENGVRTVQIDVKAVQGINNYDLELSKEIFGAGESGDKRIEIKTPAATMIIPDNMFQAADLTNAGNIGISIGLANVSALGRDIKDILGNKPVIELNATVDGKKISWRNNEAPVTIRIDYKPTEEELKNPEHITVWYIDGEGKVQSVPSGRYDPSTGRVTFQTTHFSKYAVAYVDKTFADLSGYAWAKEEVEVLAAKGISAGTSKTTYSPGMAITRADFTVMLVKALGLSAELDSNFSDISATNYFYEAVGIAKKLGIINGTGNNKFSPNGLMTRQDMAVMVRKALKAANKSMEKGSGDVFAKYTDASAIAGYAKDSLADLIKNGIVKGNTLNQINPAGSLSRAEAAVVIYTVYSK